MCGGINRLDVWWRIIDSILLSADHRLSAFGAVTLGLKAELRLAEWTADVKYERYEQRSGWRVGGQGSPNLDVFSADSLQFGMSRKF